MKVFFSARKFHEKITKRMNLLELLDLNIVLKGCSYRNRPKKALNSPKKTRRVVFEISSLKSQPRYLL